MDTYEPSQARMVLISTPACNRCVAVDGMRADFFVGYGRDLDGCPFGISFYHRMYAETGQRLFEPVQEQVFRRHSPCDDGTIRYGRSCNGYAGPWASATHFMG
ncbi:MAG TPA: hypothetical protein VFD35_10845 [Pricia sp.]|nr:hypothetical protein [Pricia sp.]